MIVSSKITSGSHINVPLNKCVDLTWTIEGKSCNSYVDIKLQCH